MNEAIKNITAVETKCLSTAFPSKAEYSLTKIQRQNRQEFKNYKCNLFVSWEYKI